DPGAFGMFFEPAGGAGPAESADQVAHGVDERDAPGGGAAAQELVRDGPEGAQRPPDSGGGETETGDARPGRVRSGAQEGAQASGGGADGDDAAAMAGPVGDEC